jgi:hypothetical protein
MQGVSIPASAGKGVVSPKAPKPKVYHRAGKIRPDGAVSAACFSPPRKIDLSRASWTFLPAQVTCPKCMAIAAVLPAVKP